MSTLFFVGKTGTTGTTGCTGTFGPTGMTGCTGTFSGVVYQNLIPYTPNNVTLGDPVNIFQGLYVNNINLGINSISFTAPTTNTFNIAANTLVQSTSVSTSTATGALQVTGGAGIGGNLYLGNTTYNNNNITLSGAKAPSGTASGTIGIAYGKGTWSTSSVSGDMVICTSNNLIMQSGNGAAGIFVNSSNNYVGIGTTNPGYLLDVNGGLRTQKPFAIIRDTHDHSFYVSATTRTLQWSSTTIQRGGTFYNSSNNTRITFPVTGLYYITICTHNVTFTTTGYTQYITFGYYNSAGTSYNQTTGTIPQWQPIPTAGTYGGTSGNGDINSNYFSTFYANATDYITVTNTTSVSSQCNYAGVWNTAIVYLIESA